MTALGALAGLLFAVGVSIGAPALVAPNRRLTERVSVILGGAMPVPWPVIFWHERLSPVLRRVFAGQGQAERLRRAGISLSPVRFRLQQLTVVIAAGFGALCWLGLMALAGRSVTFGRGVVLVGFAVLLAVVVTEMRVRVSVARRRREKFVELADIADLLALAVTAGEPLTIALARVSEVSRGALGEEITDAIESNMGRESTVELLRRLRDQADVIAVKRFFAGLAAAAERGTPVAEVLRAQAKDVRAALARELMESAGRREIAMLAPVVFLILPCVVLIALYPGFVAIRGVI